MVLEPRIRTLTLGAADLQRAIGFHRDGLGFPTNHAYPNWAILMTSGTRVALDPREDLAQDIGPDVDPGRPGFGGITLAHCTRTKVGVDEVLGLAESPGGRILKPPQDASWGGHSGYCADPDGHPWEIAWSEGWVFDAQGTVWGGSLGPIPED